MVPVLLPSVSAGAGRTRRNAGAVDTTVHLVIRALFSQTDAKARPEDSLKRFQEAPGRSGSIVIYRWSIVVSCSLITTQGKREKVTEDLLVDMSGKQDLTFSALAGDRTGYLYSGKHTCPVTCSLLLNSSRKQ